MVPEDELKKLDKNYKPNRAERRRKPVDNPWYTKATHKFKKIRNKNAPTKQQRKRILAKARKDRKENITQVS
jgi:hypothetical protein